MCDTYPTGQAADSVCVTFLQKFGIVVFNLGDEFLFRIPLKVLLQTIINVLPQVLVIHTVDDAFDVVILQLVTIDHATLRKFLMKMYKRIEMQIQTINVVIRTRCHR